MKPDSLLFHPVPIEVVRGMGVSTDSVFLGFMLPMFFKNTHDA
jgi:hypothetical protein